MTLLLLMNNVKFSGSTVVPYIDLYVTDGDLDGADFLMDGLLQFNISDFTNGTTVNTNGNSVDNSTQLCDFINGCP